MIISNKFSGGAIIAPSSKSYHHRYLIASALSGEHIAISFNHLCDDVNITKSALESLGYSLDSYTVIDEMEDIIIEHKGLNKYSVHDTINIHSVNRNPHSFNRDMSIVECGESGTTLRFLIPIVAILGLNAHFNGRGMLVKRPINEYLSIFDNFGVLYNYDNSLPLTLYGEKIHGDFEIDGNISSQILSGLLFALPLSDGDSKIFLKNELQSKLYVDMTIDVLKHFNIQIQNNDYKSFEIKGKQKYIPTVEKGETIDIEGDYSSAAFFIVAGQIGKHPVFIKGLNPNSLQGDAKIIDILNSAGGNIYFKDGILHSIPSELSAINIDAKDIPDIVPILSVALSRACGTSRITNIDRLAFKESNRIESTTSLLHSLTIPYELENNELIIYGNSIAFGDTPLPLFTLDNILEFYNEDKNSNIIHLNDTIKVKTYNDHRIAMSAAIASIIKKKPVEIDNSECVNKSYPNFFRDFCMLGGRVHV